MSDYDPNLGPGRFGYDSKDPYRAPDDGGTPGYTLLAILAGVALVGGFLYFGNPQNAGPEQAQAPAPIERTVTDSPANPAATPNPDRPAAIPLPANPATPRSPGPAPQE
jgi:hypothetical protein